MTFDPTQAKGLLTSKTFWGAVITLIASFFPGVFAHVMAAMGVMDPSMIADKLVIGFGFIFTVYGRLSATVPVNLLPPARK